MTFVAALMFALATSSQPVPDTPEPNIVGPKLLCFKYSSFQLLEGERVTEAPIGLEGMAVVIDGQSGAYEIRESELFGRPARIGTRVARNAGTAYFRRSGPIRYAVAGRTGYSLDRDALVLWISGDALNGQRADAAIYRRVAVGDPSQLRCDFRYLYGWDVALGVD